MRDTLAFRGGTALYKLYLKPAARYSEDIDLVQVKAEPAGDMMGALPDRFHVQPEPRPEVERIEAAEAFFERLPATVNHGGDRAFYAPGPDRIQLPPFAAFHDAHGYYTTRGHETVHWTSHKSRLDRSFGREKWGDEGYAREELVAELGAAFLAADLGLSLEPRPDHASYIASWIKVLQNDNRALFQAAAHAERAVAYLHQLANAEEVRAAA